MPSGLKRYHHEGEDHFITVSCYHRQPYFNTPQARDTALASLEATRQKYEVEILGYVVMPEHIHLLISEPPDHENHTIATVMQAWKISVARRLPQRPFWQRRYYDFNVSSHDKQVEKLRYMHRNPVARGLVERPEIGRTHQFVPISWKKTAQLSSPKCEVGLPTDPTSGDEPACVYRLMAQ